jgi:hypothetical protein
LLIGVPCILGDQFEAFQASEATWENKRFVVDRVTEQSLQVSSECNTELLEVSGMFLDTSQRNASTVPLVMIRILLVIGQAEDVECVPVERLVLFVCEAHCLGERRQRRTSR